VISINTIRKSLEHTVSKLFLGIVLETNLKCH